MTTLLAALLALCASAAGAVQPDSTALSETATKTVEAAIQRDYLRTYGTPRPTNTVIG